MQLPNQIMSDDLGLLRYITFSYGSLRDVRCVLVTVRDVRLRLKQIKCEKKRKNGNRASGPTLTWASGGTPVRVSPRRGGGS